MIAYDGLYFVKLLPRLLHYFATSYINRDKLIIRALIDGIVLGFILRKWLKNYLKVKIDNIYQEPKIKIPILRLYLHRLKIYLKYGSTNLSGILISMAITKHINKLGIISTSLDPLKEVVL